MARESLVHNGYREVVRTPKIPPSYNRNTSHLKVARRYDIHVDDAQFIGGPLVALDLHLVSRSAVAERYRASHACSSYTRQALRLIAQSLVKGSRPLRLVTGLDHVRLDEQQARAIHSGFQRP